MVDTHWNPKHPINRKSGRFKSQIGIRFNNINSRSEENELNKVVVSLSSIIRTNK